MAENPRIEELRRRVQADPASIAFAALAEEFRRIGEHEQAIETCRTGLQRHPAYLSARVTLGRALIETGDMEAAREELETVLRTAPENLAAIRGLAQIHEKLGQSSEMDPHLADLMNTMHAESIRVAALPPPEPVFVAPEPVFVVPEPTFVQPEPAPEPAIWPEPEPQPEPEVEMEPVRDLSLDLGAPLAMAPMDFSMDLSLDPVAEPMTDPFAGLVAVPVAEPVDSGPDPEVLATLARLDRFLGAIHSLRA